MTFDINKLNEEIKSNGWVPDIDKHMGTNTIAFGFNSMPAEWNKLSAKLDTSELFDALTKLPKAGTIPSLIVYLDSATGKVKPYDGTANAKEVPIGLLTGIYNSRLKKFSFSTNNEFFATQGVSANAEINQNVKSALAILTNDSVVKHGAKVYAKDGVLTTIENGAVLGIITQVGSEKEVVANYKTARVSIDFLGGV